MNLKTVCKMKEYLQQQVRVIFDNILKE